MENGLKSALRLSGSSVLPAYPGFMVMNWTPGSPPGTSGSAPGGSCWS